MEGSPPRPEGFHEVAHCGAHRQVDPRLRGAHELSIRGEKEGSNVHGLGIPVGAEDTWEWPNGLQRLCAAPNPRVLPWERSFNGRNTPKARQRVLPGRLDRPEHVGLPAAWRLAPGIEELGETVEPARQVALSKPLDTLRELET